MSEHSEIRAAAEELLDVHEAAGRSGASESDIVRCAVKLMETASLIGSGEARQEKDYVDLTTGGHRFEFKRRIGSKGGGVPDPGFIEQLDGYLREARDRGEPDKLGVLSDGKHWLARFPSEIGQDPILAAPYTFTLRSAVEVGDWVDWLTDRSQVLPKSRISGDGQTCLCAPSCLPILN